MYINNILFFMYFDYKMNLYKEFYNMLLCNYSYKYNLYITITIIKKAAIVFSVATLMRTYLA